MNVKTMYGKCLRKKAYSTYRIAEKECKKVSQKYGIEYHVYWCRLCGKYHLTKQKQTRNEIIKGIDK